MSTQPNVHDATVRPGPTRSPGVPRLADWADGSLAAHLERWGPLEHPSDLVAAVEQAGLRGRGGAGFPTAVKMAAVAATAGRRRRRPVVVANGSEGEPLSAKDRTLLRRNPHLVLDGMVAAAVALGADEAVVCLPEGDATTRAAVEAARAERSGKDPVALVLEAVPHRYVTGEESALVHWLNGGPAAPTLTPPRPAERGVGRRPTLVDNVETLANVALIARFGPAWWRRVGTAEDPGTTLVTVTGAVERPGVREVALGMSLGDLLEHAGAGPSAGVLVGGYFGTCLSPFHASGAHLTRQSLGAHGASIGCGAVAVLPADCCPLAEVARVAAWLAGQSAGQCGACVHGLPALAGALAAMTAGDPTGRAARSVERWTPMVKGRGACKLPDGTAHLIESGLAAFADHVAEHQRLGACPFPGAAPVLPVPTMAARP